MFGFFNLHIYLETNYMDFIFQWKNKILNISITFIWWLEIIIWKKKSHIACFEGKYFRKYIMSIKIKMLKNIQQQYVCIIDMKNGEKPINTHWIKFNAWWTFNNFHA
jgi:hypothetical protein